MQRLPIDDILADAVAALRAGPSLVIEAPPGAGKTTRVPPAIHAAGLAGKGEVVVLEPRRLAARLAARRVAEERGERAGETVGYQVRFEEVAGPSTRIRFVTEGLLTRRLLAEPSLPGVGVVVLDELHERHLQGDLALALLRRLQRTSRPDLKLVAMSATLDAGPVARFLGAASLRSEGRRFEVAVEYLSPEEAARPDVRLEDAVARAVRRLHREGIDGDVLVFLPGAAEIRRAREALAAWAATAEVDLLPLHGDLPPEEQDRAVRPGPRRKVILSTNVAETSVTLEGVVAVVDSGLARVASHSPWSGLPTLELRKISRASAAQRAGRAGRTRPGRALRLYTRHDHDARPGFEVPEILREDLSETLLALAALDAAEGLEWFEPPPPAAWEAARGLLVRLGAIDPRGAISEAGRRMLRLPVHPRQARLAIEAAARGAPDAGALLAALLGERDVRDRRALAGGALPPTGPSDLLELAQAFEEAARARFAPERLRRMGLEPGAVQAVERSRRQLQRLLRSIGPPSTSSPSPAAPSSPLAGTTSEEHALLLATLAAYPDRVARRRAPGSDEVVLVGGGSARLDPASVVREAPLLVAVDAEERRGDRRPPGARAAEARVRVASAVTDEMLLDLFPAALRYEDAVGWNGAAERVEATERLVYEDLVLEEVRAPKADPEKVAALLAEEALARGPSAFAPEGAVDRLVARLAFAARHAPDAGLSPPSDEELAAALRDLCAGRRSFAELREADLPGAILARQDPRARAALERLAPERLTLPGGRSTRVHYEAGKPPWIESRLQDFFGLAQGPALAGGKVPLVLHLLAPNQRAVQVTTDLAGFWERHYPSIRRELARRYPRHAWPEDPRHASPPPARR
ncbi:ATP-dependent helicase HrpB [Anaeromyxobacter soli]|uniref:ATP-dependent helicase HrpB n=1 Tax=Anaeromyxobacter soli TaxID=2922725 RepID=UPI001FAF1693|nr:ATP-dependent helicase HrpB [Anaeromyxobacter sp. SG29]